MKKVIAILLLIVFLFNVGGYHLAYWALQYKVDQALTLRLDRNDYSHAETFELKIPVSLPYPIYETGYERADGKFEYNGEYFNLVKRKLQNDTLYIVCIRNHEQKALAETISDYVKVTNDLPGTAKKALNFFGKLLKDYSRENAVAMVHIAPWEYTFEFDLTTPDLLTQTGSNPSPPPRS